MRRLRLRRRQWVQWVTMSVLACLIVAGVVAMIRILLRAPEVRAFGRARSGLESALEREGLSAAFVELRAATTDPLLAVQCHRLARALGEVAYAQLGFDAAVAVTDGVCERGYAHGVIEEHMTRTSLTSEQLDTLCTSDACYEGLGYGLVRASGRDLKASLSRCDGLPAHTQRMLCADGAFAAYFESETNAAETDDPFAACRAFPEPYRGVCALSAPALFLQNVPAERGQPPDTPVLAAFNWCTTLPGSAQEQCVRGVGKAVARTHVLDIAFATGVCGKAPAELRSACLDGVVSAVIAHFASPDRGEAVCTALPEADQPACQEIVERSRPSYPAEPVMPAPESASSSSVPEGAQTE
jgi:hypothetical protein